MRLTRPARIALRTAAAVGFAVIYLPLLIVLLNSLNPDRSSGWPPPGLTLHWWSAAWHNTGARGALWTSVQAGLSATAITLVLGTLIAFAVHRHAFFGRSVLSFVVVLPIALPGIVTGIALNSAFKTVLEPLGVGLGLFTVVAGHATFCVVVVFNNVVARLRRTPGSYEEAAMDLGATRWQALRLVTLPALLPSILASAVLVFALVFDDFVLAYFTTGVDPQPLSVRIYSAIRFGVQPTINAVGTLMLIGSIGLIGLALAIPRLFGRRGGLDLLSGK